MVNMFTSTRSITFDKSGVARALVSMVAVAIMILISVSANAAQISVAVDRNPIALTNSFQLTFSATKSPDDDPDFAPLQQDFDIINQQKSNQLSWVNGSTNRTVQWTLNVMAKRSGDLQIPAISFGDDASQPLSITVTESAPVDALSSDNELFLEVVASPIDTYVQAQIIYIVRFYHRINLAQATLSDPELDNAVVEKIAEDTQYNTQIKGMTYRVTERKYAIFPQQSGTMTIAPLVLTAEAITDDPRSPHNSFFSQYNTQTKRVLSKAINLNVQAAPPNLNGKHWLPAQQLALKETWSNTDLQVNVGEPITRTITISAKGATSSQLPDLSTQAFNSELKIYPDQPVINDQPSNDGIIATREQKMAFIPSAAGNFTLPALEVSWFNTETKQMEITILPVVTLVAVASANNTTNNANIPAAPITPSVQKPNESILTPSSKAPDNIWMWVAVGLGAAWLLTLLVLFWSHFSKSRPNETGLPKQKTKQKDTPINLNEIIKDLKSACSGNNPQAAQQALIKWATFSHNITNLADLVKYCDADMQAELAKLNQALYAKQKVVWNGVGLLQAVMAKQTKKSSIKKDDEPLVPLYPSQR